MIKKATSLLIPVASGLAVGIGVSHICDPHGGWSFMVVLTLALFLYAANLFRRISERGKASSLFVAVSIACAGGCVGIVRHQIYWTRALSRPVAKVLLTRRHRGWVEAEGRIKRIFRLRSERSADFIMELKRIRLLSGDRRWIKTTGENVTVRLFSKSPLSDSPNLPDWDEWSRCSCAGDYVSVKGRIPAMPAMNSRAAGGFDIVTFLVRNNLSGTLHVPASNISVVKHSEPTALQSHALRLRSRLTVNFKSFLSPGRAALAQATVLGNRAALLNTAFRGKPVKELMQEGGISHAMAVSGLHAGIVAGMLTGILALCRVSKKLWPFFVIPLLSFYVMMTGFSSSAMRALLMTSVALIVIAVGREKLGVSVLFSIALSAIIMLIARPLNLLSTGFQLSFTAVLSLVLLTRPVDYFLKQATTKRLIAVFVWLVVMEVLIYMNSAICSRLWFPVLLFTTLTCVLCLSRQHGSQCGTVHPLAPLPSGVRSLAAAQGAVQIGSVLPFSITVFGVYAVSGIVVNLAAIPLIGVFVPSALLAGLLVCLPVFGSLLAWPFAKIADLTGWLFLECGYWGAEILPQVTTGEASGVFMPVYYSCLLVFCLLLSKGAKGEANKLLLSELC